MDLTKLDKRRATEIFGWHAVHYPGNETVLRLPAGSENYTRVSVDVSGKEPRERCHEPEQRGGCYELYERIRKRNWPCRGELPDRNEQRCFVIAKEGTITVTADDLAGLTLPFAWRMLPRLRTGYLVEFTDDAMTISSTPPEDATDDELARLLWVHTDNDYARYLEHISGVKTLSVFFRQPLDPEKMIPPTPTPVGPPQYLAHYNVNGEREMRWVRDQRRPGRYNQAAARLRRALANAPEPEPDGFEQLEALEREIERHPHVRMLRFLERVGDILD